MTKSVDPDQTAGSALFLDQSVFILRFFRYTTFQTFSEIL